MATSYTSLLGLALPATGELSGTWGTTVNTAITALLDDAVAGTTSITADADITLTTTTGVANQSRQAIILWNPASGTTTRNITAPAQSKIYTVINASGGTQSIVFRGAGPTTGVTIVKGESAVVAWNGTDFIKVSNTSGAGVFTTLSVSGAVTLSGGTANQVQFLNGSKVLTGSANMTFNGTNLTLANGATIQGLTVGRGAGAVAGNTTVGASALASNTTGDSNAAIGFASLFSNVDGNYNTGVGANSGVGNVSGDQNTSVGYFSLYANASGNNNTVIGYAAGASALGSGNVMFGNRAGLYETGSNSFYVDNQDRTNTAGDKAGALLYGTFSATPASQTLTVNAALTATYGVTLSGGTANGVAYLNGSKVLTTGSALTFDGTNLATTGSVTVGTNTRVQASSGILFINGPSSIAFENGAGVENMRLNSTGLGIGTSSPTDKLTVVSTAQFSGATIQGGATNGASILTVKNSDSAGNWSLGVYGSAISGTANDLYVYDNVAGAVRLVIDNSGNLGIGTSSPAYKLDVKASGTFNVARFSGQGGSVSTFIYTDSAYWYFGDGAGFAGNGYTGHASNNTLSMQTAGTERVFIGATGNVGIGTSSPAFKLSVQGNAIIAGANPYLAFGADASVAATPTYIERNGTTGLQTFFNNGTGTNGAMAFVIGAGSEGMRLDASGNLGIGTSSPSSKLQVNSGATTTVAQLISSGANTYTPTASTSLVNANLQLGGGNASGATTGMRFTQGGSFELYFGGVQEAGGAAAFVWQGYYQTTSVYFERMRLDSAGNLGLGVTPSAWSSSYKALQFGKASAIWGHTGVNFSNFGTNVFDNGTNNIYLSNGFATNYQQGDGKHIWFTAPSGTAGNAISFTQAMSLDATSNLLVGTTNNYAVGATGYVMAKTGYVFAADNTGNAGNRNWLISPNGSGAGNLDFVDSATNTGWPNNAFRMSLTASGNLGLGVTPSAWSAATKAFQIGDSGVISGNVGSEGFALGSNWYVDSLGVIKYNFSGPTTRYTATNGFHAWYIAPSGTAGDAISFTQAMTLDASGNLSIGQTSSALQSGGTGITLYGASASELKFLNSTTGQSATDGTALVTSGSDFVINNREAGAVTFGTNNTERARITSGGDLLVGTTADGAGIGVASRLAVRVTNGYAAILRGQTVGNAIVTAWNSTTTGDGVFHEFGTETSYTARGTISYNRAGGLVAYNTTSDYRAKDISGPVTDSGALIDSTPVYMGKMHGATQERPMFIAHEVPAYAHTGEKDAVDADGNPVYQQMDASALIPVMWAEIQSLRSRVAALEAA